MAFQEKIAMIMLKKSIDTSKFWGLNKFYLIRHISLYLYKL